MRKIYPYLVEDLQTKMVLLGGPRQVGKTTLANDLLQAFGQGQYFNWDFDEHRSAVLGKRWSGADKLLIFDELHKFVGWKNWLKGLYDVRGKEHAMLVTGSARLDVYKQGGDSMLGRYHYWRLHPFSLDELPPGITPSEGLARLMTVGGFPEPFISGSERQARRWRQARIDRVLQEDIRDLESIKNIQTLRMFLQLLRGRVGGLVVLANLAQDVQISPATAKAWLEALERMYLVFAVYPYAAASARALLKPPKVYFFDNGDVPLGSSHSVEGRKDGSADSGARFENLVATHLLKRLHLLEDRDGYRCELRYIRDKEGREVDFAVFVDGELREIIEVKSSDDRISPSLRYYQQRLRPPYCTQIVANLEHRYEQDGIRVMGVLDYFGG